MRPVLTKCEIMIIHSGEMTGSSSERFGLGQCFSSAEHREVVQVNSSTALSR